jgi:hypothetical protein
LRFVFLNQHPPAAPVTLLAAPKVMIDLVDINGKTRRHTIDDHGQTGTVGLARSEVT